MDPDDILRLAVDSMSDLTVFVFDTDMRYTAVFGGAAARLGYPTERLLGRTAEEVLPAAAWAELAPKYRAALEGGVVTTLAESDDGAEVFETVFSPVLDGEEVIGGMAAARSVTDQRAALRALASRVMNDRKAHATALVEAREMFTQAFSRAPIGMALVSPDGTFLQVNRAVCEIVGRDEASLLAATFQDITHPEDLDLDLTMLAETLAGTRSEYELEKRYLRPDGTVVWVLLSVSLVRGRDGEPRFFISQIMDISDRKALEAALRHQADHDALTGLWSRSRMLEELGRWFDDRRRHDRPTVLMMVDLDGFKAVNDDHGHLAGDALLQKVASGIRGALRERDRLARMGGDEFVILLPQASLPEAEQVADRVRAAVADARVFALPPGLVHASIGLCAATRIRGVEQWLHHADAAMYRAKRAGGDRTEVADPQVTVDVDLSTDDEDASTTIHSSS